MSKLPKPPSGHSDHKRYSVSNTKITILGASITFFLTLSLFPTFPFWFYEQASGDLLSLAKTLSHEIVFAIGVIAVHESIHYLMALRNGYEPIFGIKIQESAWLLREPIPYVAIFDEYVSRNENVTQLIAPLVVIDMVALLFTIPIFPSIFAFYAKIALVVNTAGSSGDIYNTVNILKFPKNTKFLNVVDDGISTYYSVPYSPDGAVE